MNTAQPLILITGGAGGIGQACARMFKNHPLVITDYSQGQVDDAVAQLKAEGYNVVGKACDITNRSQIDALRDFTAQQGPLKGLIHTAGVSGNEKDLRKLYDIDLVATELLVDAFYDLAVEGTVAILFSSMMAHTVPADESYDQALMHPQLPDSFTRVAQYCGHDSDAMYNFVKRGVQLLMLKNLNKWGAKGARILTLSPGVIETPMALKAAQEHPERMEMIKQATPLKRNGQPQDISKVVEFLISDAASFITGTDILVDGGVIHNIKKMYETSPVA